MLLDLRDLIPLSVLSNALHEAGNHSIADDLHFRHTQSWPSRGFKSPSTRSLESEPTWVKAWSLCEFDESGNVIGFKPILLDTESLVLYGVKRRMTGTHTSRDDPAIGL